jgi:hypothetical protein
MLSASRFLRTGIIKSTQKTSGCSFEHFATRNGLKASISKAFTTSGNHSSRSALSKKPHIFPHTITNSLYDSSPQTETPHFANVMGGKPLRIMLLTNSHNSMSQRIYLELIRLGHEVMVELAINRKQMVTVCTSLCPDLIVCPFLTKVVDEQIFKHIPTWIIHPGIRGDRGMSSIDWALKNKVCVPHFTSFSNINRSFYSGKHMGCDHLRGRRRNGRGSDLGEC